MPADGHYVTGDAVAARLVVELAINSVLNATAFAVQQCDSFASKRIFGNHSEPLCVSGLRKVGRLRVTIDARQSLREI
jgi:hypothetical protein